jgi:translation initiation factor IF-2
MPPRYTYWTIILEGKPTAFRAHTRDELLPTLRQLQARHPDAVLLWFARGRLWQSPDEARAALSAQRAARERRGPGWRPGGTHQDPRERFKVPRDEKRRRFAERFRRDRSEQGGPGSQDRPAPIGKDRPDHGSPGAKPDRPRGPRQGEHRWGPPRPRDERSQTGGRAQSGGRAPSGGRPPSGDRFPPRDRFPSGDRKPSGDRRPSDRKPSQFREERGRPPGHKPDWKPGRPRGHGDGGTRPWSPDRRRSGPPDRRGGRKPGGGGRKGGGGGGSPQ